MTCNCKNNDKKIPFKLPDNYLELIFPPSFIYEDYRSSSKEYIKIDNNIYLAKKYINDPRVTDSVLNLRNIINQIISGICPCIGNRINHLRFFISDEYDGQSGFIPLGWVNKDCAIIHINGADFLEDHTVQSSDSWYHTIKHEIIHALDNCSICHDTSNKDTVFDTVVDLLYRKYMNCYKNIIKVTTHIPVIDLSKYEKSHQDCANFVIKDLISKTDHALDYAARNKSEFIAEFLSGFCTSSRSYLNPEKNTPIIDFPPTDILPDCFNNLPQNLKNDIQNYCNAIFNSIKNACPNLINDICNIWDIYLNRDPENCNKNYINELFIIPICEATDSDGCCTNYKFMLESFSGCCNSTRLKTIQLCTADLKKKCECLYTVDIYNPIEKIVDLIENCSRCNTGPTSSSGISEETMRNFEKSIVDLINSSMGSNSKFILYRDFRKCN